MTGKEAGLQVQLSLPSHSAAQNTRRQHSHILSIQLAHEGFNSYHGFLGKDQIGAYFQ